MPHILLIEDEEAFALVLKTTLEEAGHTVTVARGGREGLACYRRQPCHLILTDLIMPDLDGIETIVTLRQMTPDLKIVAMSGGGRMSASTCLKMAQKLGAERVLAKPFSTEELMAVLNAVLGPASALSGAKKT